MVEKSINSESPIFKPGTKVKLFSSATVIGKAEGVCEDAYFINDRAIGVSDGVSGWREYGLNS